MGRCVRELVGAGVLVLLLSSCGGGTVDRGTSEPGVYSLSRAGITWGSETWATDGLVEDRACHIAYPFSHYAIYQFNAANRGEIQATMHGQSLGYPSVYAMTPDYTVGRWALVPVLMDGKQITVQFSPGSEHVSPAGYWYLALIAGQRAAIEIDRTVCTFTEVYTPLPDEILAVPLKEDVQVGEGVQVAVLTGPLSFPFAYLNAAAVYGGGGMGYLGDSFNVGELGGEKWEADGVWSGMCDAFLPFDDAWVVPYESGDDTYYIVNVTPVTPIGKTSAEGWLFNIAVDFEHAGDWHIRLLGHNGEVLTTYYSGEDGMTRRVWAHTYNSAGSISVW